MDMRTIVIATLVFVLICIIGFVIFSRNHRKYSRSIVATVTKVEVEATSLSSGWVVTAQWSDQQSGQTRLFRSHRLQFPRALLPDEAESGLQRRRTIGGACAQYRRLVRAGVRRTGVGALQSGLGLGRG